MNIIKGIGKSLFCKEKDCYYMCDKDVGEIPELKCMLSPEDIVNELRWMQKKNNEYLCVCPLDSSNHLLGVERITVGLTNETQFHPALVFKNVLSKRKYGSMVSLIMAHNHPSGICEPSEQDIAITKTLSAACRIMQIPLLDHIIVGKFINGRSMYHSMCMTNSDLFFFE